jgi:hypothetical protein
MMTNDVRMLSGKSRLRKWRAAPASELALEPSAKGAAASGFDLLRTLNRSQDERQREYAMPVINRKNGALFLCIGTSRLYPKLRM